MSELNVILQNLNQLLKSLISEKQYGTASCIVDAMSLIRQQEKELRSLLGPQVRPGHDTNHISDITKVRNYALRLPPDQRAMFGVIVEDYQASCLELHGARFVSYPIMARLVNLGWARRKDNP